MGMFFFFLLNTDISPLVNLLYPSPTGWMNIQSCQMLPNCHLPEIHHSYSTDYSGWSWLDTTVYRFISGVDYWYQTLKHMYSGDVLRDERAAISHSSSWRVCLRSDLIHNLSEGHLVLEPFMEATRTEHDKHGGFVYRHTRRSHTPRQWLEDMCPCDGGRGRAGGKKKRKNGGQGEVPPLLFSCWTKGHWQVWQVHGGVCCGVQTQMKSWRGILLDQEYLQPSDHKWKPSKIGRQTGERPKTGMGGPAGGGGGTLMCLLCRAAAPSSQAAPP